MLGKNMKPAKYILVSCFALFAVFPFRGDANAVDEFRERIARSSSRRVVAKTSEEVSHALERGCRIVRHARTLTALRCAEEAAEVLGLPDDVEVFAQDTNANSQIGANVVQSGGNTGVGRKVVVLDSGYNYNHPELSSSYLGGYDFVNDDSDPADDNGHGTHVAGIITGDGRVNARSKGVAPDAGIIAGKVLDARGGGYFSDVVDAIYWAVDGPDRVFGTPDDFDADAINLSLGTARPYTYSGFCDGVLPDLTAAVRYAVDRGVLVAVAAGNSGRYGVSIPGCISYSTTVGAVSGSDRIANFSGRGQGVDIVAPGVNIYSTWLNTSYATISGTSMATPMLAGVVALVKFARPALTPGETEQALFTTALDLGRSGKDTIYGWGRVRANAAVGP